MRKHELAINVLSGMEEVSKKVFYSMEETKS
jgi:hypothetical protein